VEESVAAAVGGVERQPRHRLESIAVDADIEVEEAVPIVVERGHGAGWSHEVEAHLFTGVAKATVPLVTEQEARR
jgi:hypothetical protein